MPTNRFSQDIPGGNVDHVQPLAEQLGLRSLAASGRTEENQSHGDASPLEPSQVAIALATTPVF
jgi:hypothetical protein